jgi:hypothetical protein
MGSDNEEEMEEIAPFDFTGYYLSTSMGFGQRLNLETTDRTGDPSLTPLPEPTQRCRDAHENCIGLNSCFHSPIGASDSGSHSTSKM